MQWAAIHKQGGAFICKQRKRLMYLKLLLISMYTQSVQISTWTFNVGKAQTQTQQYQQITAFWLPCHIYLLYSSNVFPSILTRWKSPMLSCFLTPFHIPSWLFPASSKTYLLVILMFSSFFIFIFPTLKRPLYISLDSDNKPRTQNDSFFFKTYFTISGPQINHLFYFYI